jgi:hypothetical protein
MYQKYYEENTIILADKMLPIELKDKTNLEIFQYLTNDDNINQTLRAKLNYFNNEANRAKEVRQEGKLYCCFKIPWITTSGITYLSQQDIILLNYFIETNPKSPFISQFALAVKISIDLSFYSVFNRQQRSLLKENCGTLIFENKNKMKK